MACNMTSCRCYEVLFLYTGESGLVELATSFFHCGVQCNLVGIEAFDLRDNESDKEMTTSKHSIEINYFESVWKIWEISSRSPKYSLLALKYLKACIHCINKL